jgi:hypothetical protein
VVLVAVHALEVLVRAQLVKVMQDGQAVQEGLVVAQDNFQHL